MEYTELNIRHMRMASWLHLQHCDKNVPVIETRLFAIQAELIGG